MWPSILCFYVQGNNWAMGNTGSYRHWQSQSLTKTLSYTNTMRRNQQGNQPKNTPTTVIRDNQKQEPTYNHMTNRITTSHQPIPDNQQRGETVPCSTVCICDVRGRPTVAVLNYFYCYSYFRRSALNLWRVFASLNIIQATKLMLQAASYDVHWRRRAQLYYLAI